MEFCIYLRALGLFMSKKKILRANVLQFHQHKTLLLIQA